MIKPAWYDPARKPIVFTISQSESVAFDPGNKTWPFVYGSSRDGMSNVSPENMMQWVSKRHAWIKPFCQKVIDNESFTLDELLEVARSKGFKPTDYESGMAYNRWP